MSDPVILAAFDETEIGKAIRLLWGQMDSGNIGELIERLRGMSKQ